MTLVRKIKDKKVNFEFNKEYIKVVTDKIANNDVSLKDIKFCSIFSIKKAPIFGAIHNFTNLNAVI